MKRPSIDEHDVGSYLDGSAVPHKVLWMDRSRLQVDGEPDYADDGFETLSLKVLCEHHSFEELRKVGFVGPFPLPISYQNWLPPDIEYVMVKVSDTGTPTHVAGYDYGRAYFEPNEPRTRPCEVDGVETLVDNL